jgi:hypothetical protein
MSFDNSGNTICELTPEEIFDTKFQYMDEIETKLNIDIGYRFWKKYVTAAFWSYISMPLNLAITMLTALSTGQAATDNLLPKSIYVNISLATLVVSALNTYFRPYVQLNQNVDYMNKWSVMGFRFEEIYYGEKKTLDHIYARLAKYEALMKDINDLKKTEILETQNFLTDSIHLALRSCYCCLKNKNSWLALDNSLKKEDEDAKFGPPRSDFPPIGPPIGGPAVNQIVETLTETRVLPKPINRIQLLSNIKTMRKRQIDASNNRIPPTGSPDNV